MKQKQRLKKKQERKKQQKLGKNKIKNSKSKSIEYSMTIQSTNYEPIKWNRIYFLILIAFVFFMLYIVVSNWIYNEKLYPTNSDWFIIQTYQGNVRSSCFYMGEPSITIDYKTNTVSIYTYFQKREENCNEKELVSYGYPIFTISDFKGWKEVYNSGNLKYNHTINLSENKIYLKINLNDMGKNQPYSFGLISEIEPRFHSYYRLLIEGASKLDKLDFNYNSNFLKGYTCDENCFTIYEGDIKKDFKVFKGFSKSWEFNNSSVYIRFNPKSNWWLFWLKILDIFILAISAVAVYDAIVIEFFVKLLDIHNKRKNK